MNGPPTEILFLPGCSSDEIAHHPRLTHFPPHLTPTDRRPYHFSRAALFPPFVIMISFFPCKYTGLYCFGLHVFCPRAHRFWLGMAKSRCSICNAMCLRFVCDHRARLSRRHQHGHWLVVLDIRWVEISVLRGEHMNLNGYRFSRQPSSTR